jgi:hypothetical protein
MPNFADELLQTPPVTSPRGPMRHSPDNSLEIRCFTMLPLRRLEYSPHYPFIPQHSPLFTPHLLDWLALENLNHYIVHRLTRLGRQSLVSFRRFSNSLISPFAHYHSLHHVTSLASNTASVDHANRLQYHNSQIMQMECTSDRELTERCLLHCHPHATAS